MRLDRFAHREFAGRDGHPLRLAVRQAPEAAAADGAERLGGSDAPPDRDFRTHPAHQQGLHLAEQADRRRPLEFAPQARAQFAFEVADDAAGAGVAQALGGQDEVVVGQRLGACVGDGADQARCLFLALRTETAGFEEDHLAPPRFAAAAQRVVDVVVAAGDRQGREILLKGQVREGIAAFATRDQQTGTFLDDLEKTADGGVEVARIGDGAGELPGQQFAQRRRVDLLLRALVHGQRQLLQDQPAIADVEGAFVADQRFRNTFRLVPLAEQHIDRFLIQFGAAIGQLDAVAVNQRDDGEQQRVDRQFAYAVVFLDRLQELLGLPFGEGVGALARPHLADGDQAVPLRQELANVVEREVANGRRGVALGELRGVGIADDAAGDDASTVGIGAREGVDEAGDATAQRRVGDFVEAVEQQRGAAAGESLVEEVGGHRDALVAQQFAQELEHDRVSFGAIVTRAMLGEVASDLA
ncbi:MAG: hypothetical protein AW09_004214 [Candidatus Accumulibacter phosphatis]|uniref:Uncharacterized protein n=1 Tax=Candidatus Accumulibacter phosphatis TaxID=327160 RepID=A0A080M0C7_9PROT|nr:MAG: hypothetical protein AW09_004214 [Candidatus Accumulibacter phosphatis]